MIFTTAYDKYALEAFKFSAIDYLLKPIDKEDLDRSIRTLQKRTSPTELATKVDTLFHNLNMRQPQGQRIALPSTDGITFVLMTEIIRCQANVNYTHFFMKNGQKMTVARTLKSYEQLLEPYNFARIHNAHLINIAHVEKYTRGKGGVVTMSDGSELEVSVRKKDAFLSKIMNKQ